MSSRKKVFALVVGSGFSGSLLAWILHRQGKEVILIDRLFHPRFAIGESTTPTADFLVKHIAERWGLPELAPLASYGAWQRAYPDLVCGKKRGFAYYAHQAGAVFQDDDLHSHSLLVAASVDDERSDTHWLRSSMDAWLFERAIQSGVVGMEGTTIKTASFEKTTHLWEIVLETTNQLSEHHDQPHAETRSENLSVSCEWLIDASGGSPDLRRWTGNQDDSDWMRTKTSAIFGHFNGVAPFASQTSSYPADRQLFDGDDSAQHHVFESGWMWSLRFKNGTTSLGFVFDQQNSSLSLDYASRHELWRDNVLRFPSIARMLERIEFVAPEAGLQVAPRLSRCQRNALGDGWVSLPTSFGFVDPLHSTGIAHALSGVHRIAQALLSGQGNSKQRLQEYAVDVRRELEWLDTMVSLTYRGLPSFHCFTALASFYFVSAIGFERDVAKDPEYWPRGYMLARDMSLRATAEEAYYAARPDAHAESTNEGLMGRIRHWIAPWNDVGLLDPMNRNRIAHSVAPKS
jgi:tetracycline 7-halogenase / FADH2 O2-dependent halogenase